jgi:hypothetical protein
METVMKTTMLLLLASAVALSPNAILAAKMSYVQNGPPTGHMRKGSTKGVGWDHMNGPTRTGQPGAECEDARPGRAATAPGSAFNEEGRAGTRYAGEQPQNSRNTASVSQYDIACLNQPQH